MTMMILPTAPAVTAITIVIDIVIDVLVLVVMTTTMTMTTMMMTAEEWMLHSQRERERETPSHLIWGLGKLGDKHTVRVREHDRWRMCVCVWKYGCMYLYL